MEPPDSDSKRRIERDDTDASLRAERTKTDSELAQRRTEVDQDADDVMGVARDRAESTLRTARDRADREMTTSGAPSSLRRAVEGERAKEDGAVATELAVAAELLQLERDESERALSALLRREREATDDGLLVERARADEAVASRDNFLGMVSHDLRTMLGGIALSAASIANKATGDTESDALTRKQAERIERFTARMGRLVGDLLDVVSLEAGMLQITAVPLDAGQLVKEAVEAFQPSFSAKGVELTAQTSEVSVLAMFDHERIFQVLANLLSNALKFTERGGKVALSVAQTGSEVRVCITDTGLGIAPDQRTAIFERFRQVSTKDRRGLGLGLYIAKSIIEAHGGRIWAESPEAGGSAFHFTLAAAQAVHT